jgi:hypothetical protein
MLEQTHDKNPSDKVSKSGQNVLNRGTAVIPVLCHSRHAGLPTVGIAVFSAQHEDCCHAKDA